MTIVSPSHWLTNLARNSGIFSKESRFETIHYGLDTDVYYPVRGDQMGFDSSKTTLLFGAADLGVKRKGAQPLFEALCQLPDPQQYECVIFGDGDLGESGLDQVARLMPVKEIGYLESEEEKRKVYSAADIFLLPSLEDNQPQTGLESLACGTPVIGFDAGGISDFVQHGKTGLLAKVNEPGDLAKQIRWLAESPDSQKSFGQNGRNLIENEFEIRQQTEKYLRLYRRLLSGNKSRYRRAG